MTAPDRDALAEALAQVALTDMWDESPQPDGSIVASVNRYKMADAILAALPAPRAAPDLWSIARHVATDSSAHNPRYHHPSGECEQYGTHIHQPGFIVWEREAAAQEPSE